MAKLMGITSAEYAAKKAEQNKFAAEMGLKSAEELVETETAEESETSENSIENKPEKEEKTTTLSKLYSVLSNEQIEVLKSFYLWSSQILFREAPDKVKLKLSDSRKAKLEKLDAFKAQGTAWVYAGFIDFGVTGAAHCTLGHALRYKHYAWDMGYADLQLMWGTKTGVNWAELDKMKNSGHLIEFGIDCIGDFFDVPPEQLALIKGLQAETADEMEELYGIYKDNPTAAKAKFKVFEEVMAELGKRQAMAVITHKKLPIQNELMAFYLDFKKVGMIYPRSLVKGIQRELFEIPKGRYTEYRYLSEEKLVQVLELVNKDGTEGIVKILREPKGYLRWNGANSDPRIISVVRNYLENFFRYQFAGIYAFNPYSDVTRNKDEGNTNKGAKLAYSAVTGCGLIPPRGWSGYEFNDKFSDKDNTSPYGKEILAGLKIKNFKFTLEELEDVDDYLEEIQKWNTNLDAKTLKIPIYTANDGEVVETGAYLEGYALVRDVRDLSHSEDSKIKYLATNSLPKMEANDFSAAAQILRTQFASLLLERKSVEEKIGGKLKADREVEAERQRAEIAEKKAKEEAKKAHEEAKKTEESNYAKCPECGGDLKDTQKGVICEKCGKGCSFAIWKKRYYGMGITITIDIVSEILLKGSAKVTDKNGKEHILKLKKEVTDNKVWYNLI